MTLLLSFRPQAGALRPSCLLVWHASLPLLRIIVLSCGPDRGASSHLFGGMGLASCTCSPGTCWFLLRPWPVAFCHSKGLMQALLQNSQHSCPVLGAGLHQHKPGNLLLPA